MSSGDGSPLAAGMRANAWQWFRWVERHRASDEPQPSNGFFNAFARCAAAASLFELKARMLADNTPELRERAVAAKLDTLVDAEIARFESLLSNVERDLLKRAVRVRNKLFHAELSRVTGQLVELGAVVYGGRTWMADLATGEVTKVEGTSTAKGRLFGWLLESGQSGAFLDGVRIFRRGIALIDWMLVHGVADERGS